MPVDTVNRVVPQLIARGKYVRPALGVEVDEELNRRITQQLGTGGVAVLRVSPQSAAAAAGLRGVQARSDGALVPGDVILSVDGRAVESVAQLLSHLDDYEVGGRVRLTLLRDGKRVDVSVTLQEGNQ